MATAARGIRSEDMARIDADKRLLCESCGYDLEGLPDEGACAECGRRVVDSWPERRAGSAWQQRANPNAWWTTARMVAAQPRTMWERVRVDTTTSNTLMMTNAGIAAALPTVAMVSSSSVGIGSGFGRFDPAMVVTWFAAWGGMWIALMILTWIEARGIRFFGARNGWRVSRSVAATVCGHASYGWVVAGLLVAGLWFLLERTQAIKPIATAWNWFIGLLSGNASAASVAGASTRAMELSYLTVLGIGFVIGMLIFEVLVYIGVRRLRFANAS